MNASDLKNKKLFSLADTIILLLIVAISLAGVLLLPKKAGEVADVYVSGKLYASLPLNRDTELTVTTEKGTNVVTVSDGKVFISRADCKGQDCVAAGKISKKGSAIACLPHEVKIVVRGETGVDG